MTDETLPPPSVPAADGTPLRRLELFSTCPPSDRATDDSRYRALVADVARWSERAGCRGILVYSDNRLVDPWLVAQIVIQSTERLSPLVAVQPVYMHPYTVAKKVASLGWLYGRKIFLNMVSGGFRNDLLAFGDETAHDDRYRRLVEYSQIIQWLLEGGRPVTFEGDFYRVSGLSLEPGLPEELRPELFAAGSSEAGLEAAALLGATAVKYPRPASEEAEEPAPTTSPARRGIRVGIVARDHDAEAWKVATTRFPGDRRGQLLHELAMKVSDSQWHAQLSRVDTEEGSPYWLFPFRNYHTMCPYLVGSYDRVGEEIGRYVGLGTSRVILDVPPAEEELWHCRTAVEIGAREGLS